MSLKSTKSPAAETVKPTREPSPVVMIAALTEAAKVLLGELKGLAGETFSFQLRLMEMLPEADRLAAFQAVLAAHQHEVSSDERISLALFNLTEKLGVAAAAIIPPALALRQAEIAERAAEREERAAEREERAAEREEREAVESIRTKSSYVNGKVTAEAK